MEDLSLTQLHEGEIAKVSCIKTSGAMRRRLIDLGLIEGTQVECLFKSPSGDPAAYTIRGAAIALRFEDADTIRIQHISSKEEKRG